MLKQKIKILHKFNNLLIKKGKKAKANTLILNTFYFVKRKTKKNPINLVFSVLKTIIPGITTKKTVIAGRLYHLPSPITKNKSIYFGCKWLQQAASENKELKQKTFDLKLADECFKVLKKKGQSLVLLKQHNKTVSENRPFLRFVRRKFKPRLPRKVWLKKKKMLWLSRRKKFRKKYLNNFDYHLTLQGSKKVMLGLKKKFAKRSLTKVYKILNSRKTRALKKITRKAKIRIFKDRKRNPKKYIKLDKMREKIVNKINNKKQFSAKKITKYEQRSNFYKQKHYHQNQTINNKNKFQRRA